MDKIQHEKKKLMNSIIMTELIIINNNILYDSCFRTKSTPTRTSGMQREKFIVIKLMLDDLILDIISLIF